MLVVAGIRLALCPQSRTARLLGEAHPVHASHSLESGACDEARRVGRAVERVAAVLAWRPVCLPQAVAVAWMLRRRGIDCVTHLGITNAKPSSAHAWVTVGDAVVQGAPIDHVTELAMFV